MTIKHHRTRCTWLRVFVKESFSFWAANPWHAHKLAFHFRHLTQKLLSATPISVELQLDRGDDHHVPWLCAVLTVCAQHIVCAYAGASRRRHSLNVYLLQLTKPSQLDCHDCATSNCNACTMLTTPQSLQSGCKLLNLRHVVRILKAFFIMTAKQGAPPRH